MTRPLTNRYNQLLVAAIFVALGAMLWGISLGLNTRIVEYRVDVKSHPALQGLAGYRLAVVSDLHLQDDDSAFANWRGLIDDINRASPDHVLLLGDYSKASSAHPNLHPFIDRFARSLDRFESPIALVLGNYETWTDRQAWLTALSARQINVLENQVLRLGPPTKPLCVRGIGDHYTGKDRYLDFPPDCAEGAKVTITHDPAGVFAWDRNGLFLAGHTHCGQVQIPFLGMVWAPTDAPPGARCGLYLDGGKVIFTSSGVGTSILPVRLLARSQIEILTFE